jgi:transcriptional regulator with GAF, ATPase, and Fis domain
MPSEPTKRIRPDLGGLQTALDDGARREIVFARLHDALSKVIAFKVLTVLKLDPATLRSVRLYSSEPSYPIGGTKQHVPSAWSEAILERNEVFLAHDLAALRATFPDSAAIEATGCGSIIATPIIYDGSVVGTLNLWHASSHFDESNASLAVPFANVIARIVRDTAVPR